MNAIAGIEDVSFYGGSACLDVNQLAENRGLDRERFDNLLMKEKAVALPFEYPVSFAINAARPLLSRLSPEDKVESRCSSPAPSPVWISASRSARTSTTPWDWAAIAASSK